LEQGEGWGWVGNKNTTNQPRFARSPLSFIKRGKLTSVTLYGTLPTMKERTLRILAALINDFVESATPVASKKLLESGEFHVSSATVRNEFALLEEIGLIESPHVSAGKIPTEKGYRFFVDQLLQEDEVEDLRVQALFEKHIAEYHLEKTRESLFDMIKLCAHLSGNVAFASIENDQTLYLGLSKVLRSPEFLLEPERGAQIVEVFERREQFQEMLSSLDLNLNEVKIFIGNENLFEEVQSCAMLVVRFENKGIQGHVGILGPMRMNYGFNRALLRNVIGLLR
jgi:heat-inducible transcriptional repressor